MSGPAEKQVIDEREPGVPAPVISGDAEADFPVKHLHRAAAERIDARQQPATVLASEPDFRRRGGPGRIEIETFDVRSRRGPRAGFSIAPIGLVAASALTISIPRPPAVPAR